jgi:outer membrane biosynthesis protein TonB
MRISSIFPAAPVSAGCLFAPASLARVLLSPAALFMALGLLLATPAAAQVYRCEGADGRVTYTNEPCPSTARRTRTVDDSPPVQAQRDRPGEKPAVKADESASKAESEPKAEPAKADVAKADVAKPEAAKPDAKAEPAKDAAKAARATASGATASQLRTANNLSPAQQMEQLDLERARQRRACDQLDRQLAFARRDVDAATGGQRASAELQLRRLQEDYLVQCPMQR